MAQSRMSSIFSKERVSGGITGCGKMGRDIREGGSCTSFQ